MSGDDYGWKNVRRNLQKILDYGASEGIIQAREEKGFLKGLVAQVEVEAEEEAERMKSQDVVQIPTNDVSTIHEAIPFLPVPIALLCLFLNIFTPGIGTILSGFMALCMGQPRLQVKEGRGVATLIINVGVGLSQLMTVTFLFVGWFWSLAWGGLMLIHSLQYRTALLQRRQEAVATAAIEALTKDSILHRKDVKSLVRGNKDGKGDKGGKEKKKEKGK